MGIRPQSHERISGDLDKWRTLISVTVRIIQVIQIMVVTAIITTLVTISAITRMLGQIVDLIATILRNFAPVRSKELLMYSMIVIMM